MSIVPKESTGASKGLGVIWNHRKVALDILSLNNNWISSKVQSLKSNLSFILINVYGPTSSLEKRIVWDEISRFLREHQNNLIILGGDFKTILNMNKKTRDTSLNHPKISKYGVTIKTLLISQLKMGFIRGITNEKILHTWLKN